MIGYTKTTKIWKLWDLKAKRMIRSTDIFFVEEENAIIRPIPAADSDMMDIDSDDTEVLQAVREGIEQSQAVEVNTKLEKDEDSITPGEITYRTS